MNEFNFPLLISLSTDLRNIRKIKHIVVNIVKLPGGNIVLEYIELQSSTRNKASNVSNIIVKVLRLNPNMFLFLFRYYVIIKT